MDPRRPPEPGSDSAPTVLRRGLAFAREGKLDDAIALFQQVVQIEPDHASAHYNWAHALRLQGRLDEAASRYREALRRKPDLVEALHNLAGVLCELGEPGEAVELYRRVLELKPGHVPAHNGLGTALKDLGKLDDAAACYHRALELDPGSFEVLGNQGNLHKDRGLLTQAVESYRKALALRPQSAEVHSNLSLALLEQGKLVEAEAAGRRAVQLSPDLAKAHNSLGNVLGRQGKLEEAIASYRRALELEPDFAEAHNNLGNTFKDQGRLDEAATAFRRALELKPADLHAHSNLLCLEQYLPEVNLAGLAESHARWDFRHASPRRTARTPHANPRDPERPLRLGFVSPDLRRHPVGRFFVRALEALSSTGWEAVCYHNHTQQDALTHRMQAAAKVWREVRGAGDEELAEQIRRDGIDVLFDLAGHTSGGRLLLFADKPAPIQVAWIGYEGTTGLADMDYLVADGRLVPPEVERHYREKILRLPRSYVAFDPPTEAPPVGPPPALARGYVTFGSFNNPAKITPQVVALWSRILREVPRSRLVLKYGGLQDPGTRRHIEQLFSHEGLEPARLELRGWSPYAAMLAEYGEIDLALDPFPFAGGATSCEALWMGAPVITTPGETFAGRHTYSYLSSIGATDTVAEDPASYAHLAIRLAQDLPRLAAWRADQRERMARSPLCDGPRLAADLADALRVAWRRWCAAEPGS